MPDVNSRFHYLATSKHIIAIYSSNFYVKVSVLINIVRLTLIL